MARSTTPNDKTPGDDKKPEPTPQLPIEQLPTQQFGTEQLGTEQFDTATAPPVPAPTTEPVAAQPFNAERSFVRRHPLGVGIAGAAIAVVLVSGLTAWGVGAAVTASLTSSAAATAPTAAAPVPAAGAGRGKGLKALAGGKVIVRATIDGIDGSTWTVTTGKGAKGTLTVDSATQFGTKRAPATASSFAVGDSVMIVATPTSTSTDALAGTANRVVMAKTAANGSTPQPTPMQSTAPTT